MRRYAPDSVNAKSASEYITVVAQRALQAAEVWARTGNITGVPEGVSTEVPGAESTTPGVQAKARSGGVKNANDPQVIKAQLGEGQPLASGVRSRMESAFGMNFSNVRTHTDSNASAISNQVNARAFTVGNHVAFGGGEYNPGTVIGDALIAHELAHTIQQQGEETSVNKMQINSHDYNQLEADADLAAENAIGAMLNAKTTGTMPKLRSGIGIQRCSSNSKAEKLKVNVRPVSIAQDDGKKRNDGSFLCYGYDNLE